MALLYKVTQILTGVAGSPYYLSGHFLLEGGTAQQAATAWAACVRGPASSLPVGGSYAAIAEVDIIESTSGQAAGVSPVTVAQVDGTSGNEFLPPICQGLIRWRTNTYQNGREIRGRTNLPLIPENDSTGGVPSAAYITAINTRAAALIADTNSQHIIYARSSGSYALTQTGTCWNQFAALRSRRD